MNGWDYSKSSQFPYGAEDTYKCIEWLDELGTEIQDWGCGTAYAKKFVKKSKYTGIDFTPSKYADLVQDLRQFTSSVDCIFMRHILEHNHEWRKILQNALRSFKKRFCFILFMPLSENTHDTKPNGIPEYSFNINDILKELKAFEWKIEKKFTRSFGGVEHIFYMERK
jgi:SAM-dependent methyltransferase